MHQFRDKNKIAKRKRIIKNSIFVVIFLLLAVFGLYKSLNGPIHFFGRSFWKVNRSISSDISNLGYIYRTKASVYKDNENLLEENSKLKTSMIDYEILKKENTDLKESLGRIIEKGDLVLSNILTKPNYSPYDTIIIDIGIDKGISIGNIVYSNEIIPIGKVSAVYENTSLVTLYSNPGEVTQAMIDGTNTSVELVGRGGGNFEMIIPIDLPFTNGTFVVLPNISSEIIATIEDVISSPNDPVKKVLLSSPVNVQSLKWVFVKRK